MQNKCKKLTWATFIFLLHTLLLCGLKVFLHSEKNVQKLSLGWYLFKRYTFCTLFVPKGCILVLYSTVTSFVHYFWVWSVIKAENLLRLYRWLSYSDDVTKSNFTEVKSVVQTTLSQLFWNKICHESERVQNSSLNKESILKS